ncbi:MAG: putative LPS assembly protein LptD [Bacteroidota bacterium]
MALAFNLLYSNAITGQVLKSTDSTKQNLSQTAVAPTKTTDTFRISKDAIEDIIEYSADDSIYFDLNKRMVYLYGNAHVVYDGMNLKAALIIVDFNKRELYARGITDSIGKYYGRPNFNDGERETDADTMIYNFATKRGRTYGIAMKEGEGYILCNKVFRDDDKSIYSDLGRYTTCSDPHPHFYLQSKKLKIIPDKKIIFGPSNLVIEGVPTPLYIPFGMFPTKKGQKSGIIPFEYGLSGAYGAYLRNVGYYFGISKNFDQTITGDIYFRGSWRLGSNTRYAKRYRFNGGLSLEFSKFLNGEPEDPDFKANQIRTFGIRWIHSQDGKARPGTTFNANVDIQKNNSARLNSTDPTTIVRNQFNSSVSFSKALFANKANFTSNINHSQNTQTRQFSMSLPSINFSVQRVTPFSQPNKLGKYKWYKDFGVSYQMSFENRIDTRDSLFFTGEPLRQLLPEMPRLNLYKPNLDAANQFKQGMVHSIPITLGSYKLIKNRFTFSPTVAYQEFWYFKTVEKYWNYSKNKVDTIYHDGFKRASDYNAAVNLNTQIFGTFAMNSKKVSAIRHTIKPNVGFSYRPDYSEAKYGIYKKFKRDSADDSLYKYSIFEQGIKGGPAGGPSGRLTFGIDNNLQAKVLRKTDTSSKYENVTWLENFNVSGNYNFLADSMKLSNIAVTAYTTLFKQVRLNGNATLNPYAKSWDYKKHRSIYTNTLEWENSKRIGTWTSASIQMSTEFNAEMFKKKNTDTAGKTTEEKAELEDIRKNPNGYVHFDIPWSFNINYSMNYSLFDYKSNYQHNFGISGDFNLTPKWKIGCNTGYDFLQKKMAFTQFKVTRSLHCWALSFDWIPDGVRKSFSFSLYANSSMLQDLKIKKNRLWNDQ